MSVLPSAVCAVNALQPKLGTRTFTGSSGSASLTIASMSDCVSVMPALITSSRL